LQDLTDPLALLPDPFFPGLALAFPGFAFGGLFGCEEYFGEPD
jgi:hypothetical protein